MQTNEEKLRDQAAGPVVERVSADSGRVSEKLKPFLDTIKARLFDPKLDLTSLCLESGGSRWLANRQFVKELGISPWAYVTNCRMQVSTKLLVATQLRVYQIATVLGYPSRRDTFSEVFERWSGKTPSAYRKLHGAPSSAAPSSDTPSSDAPSSDAPSCDTHGKRLTAVTAVEVKAWSVEIQNLSVDLALAHHERGAELTWSGHVDRAYADLRLARDYYAAAGELSPKIRRWRRHISVAFDTDEALNSALCPECRTSLAGDQGDTLRKHLSRALEPIPRDLQWFGICCDECRRVVWQAISRARLGLMDDAWKAWWLSVNVDLDDRDTPPSRGRFIAALAEVERRVGGDQLERKVYCDLAVNDAIALDDPLLEAEARIWRASVLRALGRHADSREELGKTAEASQLSPWLAALQDRVIPQRGKIPKPRASEAALG